jgi:zinc transport system substrate-binding protein
MPAGRPLDPGGAPAEYADPAGQVAVCYKSSPFCADSTMARLATMLIAVLLTSPVFAAGPLVVAVSIAPQAWLAEAIGGEQVRVITLVGANDSPATYAPGPRDLIALDEARVWFLVDVPFEGVWAQRVRADRPKLELISLVSGLPSRPADPGDVGHGPVDPHRWTDPRLFARMAGPMLDALIRMDPENAAVYRGRHAEVTAALMDLDEQLRARLEPFQGRSFLTVHPSWGYYADAYGLKQIAIEHRGHEPGPRRLADVLDQARAENVRVLLVQRQFSRRTASAVAAEIGAAIVEADPLAADYPDNLARVTAALAEAFE